MEDRSMPDTRGLLFIVNERQRRWWLDAAEDRRAEDARNEMAPLPVEPQQERSTQGQRLAFRLRLIIRPSAG
jgi:hypothetical protein